MKNLIKVIAIVLVGTFVSVVALMVGYQFGMATQVKTSLIENKPSQVLPNQPRTGIPNEAFNSYVSNCAGCHGTVGQGSAIAPALNHPDLRARLDDPEIQATIEYGRPGTAMPAWKNRLTDSQIDSLTSLIRNWDELDAEQLSELESLTPYRHGMGGWQEKSPMPGAGCNAGMGGRGRRSP